jgi:protein-arginine kinase activator protein McsA
MATIGNEKVARKYICESCDYCTSKKSSYDKHLSTSKHKLLTNVNTNATKSCKNEFNCLKCNKKYKSRVGLWKHKNKCYPDEPSDKQIITMLIKDNSELKNMVMEVIKNGTHNTINNTNNNNTNSHNKAFNLNFFLNETCKGAMNIMDFVDSIKLQLTDLERVGEFGFVDGINQ